MALKRIVLRDFVIVAELEVDFAAGFTVLTGETGAGKSILIDALQLALGARADAGSVREGAQRAEVSAEFDSSPALQGWLAEAGFDGAPELLLRRTVDTQGRSRGWINGSPATAAQMRALGEQLVDIHGQHAWQSLTRADAVRELLDAYAGLDARPLAQAWRRWREADQALAQAQAAQDSLQRERDRLAWQIGEIERLAPGEHEWPELNARHARQAHAQALLDAARAALEALQDGESPAVDAVHRAQSALQAQARHDAGFAPLIEELESAQAQLADAAHALRGYLRRTEPDPQELARLDERMGQWLALARRYKRPPEELHQVWADWKAELARLDQAADLDTLRQTLDQARAAYDAEARKLSRRRATAATTLSERISAAMQGLGMEGGRFEVALSPCAQPQQHGLEDVGFLVAGHAGSSPRPVAKVASGGELSRIALAIAVTTSQHGQAGTLLFDEVDAGVGGAVAQVVGQLMRRLGQDRQVMAVTHLPQVAACADHHLVVSKRTEAGITLSSVRPVTGEARVREVARMLGGEHVLSTTLAHAKDLLQSTG